MNMYDENKPSASRSALNTNGVLQQFGITFDDFFGFLLRHPQSKQQVIGLMFYSSPKKLNVL